MLWLDSEDTAIIMLQKLVCSSCGTEADTEQGYNYFYMYCDTFKDTTTTTTTKTMNCSSSTNH